MTQSHTHTHTHTHSETPADSSLYLARTHHHHAWPVWVRVHRSCSLSHTIRDGEFLLREALRGYPSCARRTTTIYTMASLLWMWRDTLHFSMDFKYLPILMRIRTFSRGHNTTHRAGCSAPKHANTETYSSSHTFTRPPPLSPHSLSLSLAVQYTHKKKTHRRQRGAPPNESSKRATFLTHSRSHSRWIMYGRGGVARRHHGINGVHAQHRRTCPSFCETRLIWCYYVFFFKTVINKTQVCVKCAYLLATLRTCGVWEMRVGNQSRDANATTARLRSTLRLLRLLLWASRL